MLKLFKKKEPVYIDLEDYDYSAFARDMTEEELLTVNGGKWIGNSNEAVAKGEVGDTLKRNDGTIVTITEGDIKWAQEQISSPSTTSTTTTTETSSSSTTSSESNNDRPRDQNNSSGSGGSKVNLGTGTMTVSDYIAQQKKKGAGATPAGKAVEVRKNEGQAAEGNLTERGYPSSRDPNPGKYNPKKEEALPVKKNTAGTGNLSEQGYPNSRTPDVGTFYPRQKTNSENRKIKTSLQEFEDGKRIMGENIYSEYYILKNVPEQYQEAAIRAMHEEEKNGLYGSPTDSKRMTTPVGVKTECQDKHTGVDIGALVQGVKGDPIYATADGKVIDFRITDSKSSLLEISLPDTKDRAIYQHATFIVSPGDEVKRGQVIGYMDNIGPEGMATHLHYEIRKDGLYAGPKVGGVLVDPVPHMPGTYYYEKKK